MTTKSHTCACKELTPPAGVNYFTILLSRNHDAKVQIQELRRIIRASHSSMDFVQFASDGGKEEAIARKDWCCMHMTPNALEGMSRAGHRRHEF